jgi:hypothetical protein
LRRTLAAVNVQVIPWRAGAAAMLRVASWATVAWLVLGIAFLLVLHDWLGIEDKMRLGETGDYLAGWFTPLAFGWFIITVLLQRDELKHQRRELKLMRDEYQQSRIAAENQVQQLAAASLTAKQEIFMQMLEQSKYSFSYNCEKVIHCCRALINYPNTERINQNRVSYGASDGPIIMATEFLPQVAREGKGHQQRLIEAAKTKQGTFDELVKNMKAFCTYVSP